VFVRASENLEDIPGWWRGLGREVEHVGQAETVDLEGMVTSLVGRAEQGKYFFNYTTHTPRFQTNMVAF
jgi:hypothetical protein